MPFTSGRLRSIRGRALALKQPGGSLLLPLPPLYAARPSISPPYRRHHVVSALLSSRRLFHSTGWRRGQAQAQTENNSNNNNNRLNLVALDKKWQEIWAASASASETPSNTTDGTKSNRESESPKPSKYILPMFPYPSGNLHLGHLRVYTIADVVARFHTLQGHDVVLPMGWDAFGLPAENAAIERGVDPAAWTHANIARMKEQLSVMNGSWDWSRELATCDPGFYRHTQKIFLLLLEKGLAYQAEAEVNYDPVDKTVLANEQVDANGCSWRSGAKVEKRRLKQWFLRISAFRDELLADLDALARKDAWPERVLAMQRNWLGRSRGAMVKFPVMAFGQDVAGAAIEVFTTRPDTLFGVQYLALAAAHPVVADLARRDPELQAFLDTLPGLPPDSKVGYLLPHLRAVNPLAYHEDSPEPVRRSLPVYVAPYVLGDYGEGAVMGVPGHDARDHAFWREHHDDEPVRVVLALSEDESTTAVAAGPFVDHGVMTAHGGPFRGKPSRAVGETLVSMLEAARLAKPAEKWRLRDWLVSRQRYWGTPIPVVHCASCGGAVPVPDDQLPVELPAVDHHWAERRAGNPLEALADWVHTECPRCGGPAKRDTDTMDTFVDSSWYYMRFVDPHNQNAPFSADKAGALLPVDLYIGGIEHAILHLLYARFIYKFLMTSSLVENDSGKGSGTASGKEEEDREKEIHEPFKRLVTQGMVHGKTYSDPTTGRFLKPDEVDLATHGPDDPRVAATGTRATVSFEKMSKSKHNGVDPTAFIARYGADATRAHMLFQAPASDVLYWDERKIAGVTRWLGRVHALVMRHTSTTTGDHHGSSGPPPPPLDPDAVAAYLRSQQGSSGDAGSAATAAAQWDADCALWMAVQKAIASVTAAYRSVYALNTAVSDLMGLTNAIAAAAAADRTETGRKPGAGAATPRVRRAALDVLVRLMAPVTPAFAEECWAALHPAAGSVFQTGRFPVVDTHNHNNHNNNNNHNSNSNGASDNSENDGNGSDSPLLLHPRTQTCAVQVNGKLRFVVDIPVPPAALLSSGSSSSSSSGAEVSAAAAAAALLKDFVVGEILKTEVGRARVAGDAGAASKVLVVRGGRLVNFVV